MTTDEAMKARHKFLIAMIAALPWFAGCASRPEPTEPRVYGADEISRMDDQWMAVLFSHDQDLSLLKAMVDRHLIRETDAQKILDRKLEIGMSEYALLAARGMPQQSKGEWQDELITSGNHRRVTYHYKDATYWVEDGLVGMINRHN